MFITLTNAAEQSQGRRITLNTEHIVSIFEMDKTAGVDDLGMVREPRRVTCLFVPPHGTWEVEESHEDILALMAVV